jgi:hypothetical protein
LEKLFSSFTDILRDKDPFKHLKAPLNILFVCNITYCLYCIFYPSAPNLKSATQISWAAYFLNGEYIILFGVFVLAWAFTWLLGLFIFNTSNLLISERIRTWILEQSISKAFDTGSNNALQGEILAMAKAPRRNWVVHLYKHFIGSIPKEKIPRIKRAMQLTQEECSADFVLITRALIVLLIAFIQVSYFGKFLFAALILFLIGFAVTLYFGYQLAAIIPIIGYKLGSEIDENERREKFLTPDVS